ncbi:DUF3144 domain-containing protein [Salinisphaera sp. Q1T1-3]|uniref:DUF3144 domain-containing protein n=1 Tax=Salinisphaera sp. Q1T1-3 TaxID=2321229 RepID=UPI000E71BBD5|nr:DUF3144 domain-containing protein [Salinisphaera sp. Q1T1-3]RJS92402.1 DUF3144 domain-containing protein [Salinisphaera sp. Q1T1-3]
MSENSLTPEFRARADAIIDLLNQQASEVPTGQVSASVMYAAARFNAFQVAATAENAEEMAAEREAAVNYFTSQYRKMFEDHFGECLKHFDRYTGRGGD